MASLLSFRRHNSLAFRTEKKVKDMNQFTALSVVLLVSLLAGCESRTPVQQVSQNDLIQEGLVLANAQRAGEVGIPVELISIARSDNGDFSAVLANEQQHCRYTINGKLQGGKVTVDKKLRQECTGVTPTILAGAILPRYKTKDPKVCSGEDRERLLCFTETYRANRELVLALAR